MLPKPNRTKTTLTLLLTLFLSPTFAHASIDQAINDAVAPATAFISSIIFYAVDINGAQVPLVVAWLVAAAIFFTVYFRFLNIRGFMHAIHIVRGKDHNPKAPGEVTHFQALTTAVSGTVGLGNIGGVAVAISLGGPGATFWMILSGLIGMSLKFCECTLGVKYRNINPDGTVSGGPMYYLSKGLEEKGFALFGNILAYMFAIFCIFASLGGGNMFQVNQSLDLLIFVTGGSGSFLDLHSWVYGLIIALLVGLV